MLRQGLAVSLLVALGAAAAPAHAEDLPRGVWRDIRCFSDGRVLPAITLLEPFYGQVTRGATPPCPRPKVAAVAGVFDGPAELQRAWRAMRKDGLAFGYPFAAPSYQVRLELPTSKIAIVAGLFASARDADAWSAKHPGFRQIRVSEDEVNVENVGRWEVVQLDAPQPVPAVDRRQARDDTARADPAPLVSSATGERAHPLPPRRPPRPPVCEVPGDALFVWRSGRFDRLREIRGADDYLNFTPVPCGKGRTGYVDPRSTTSKAVFWRDRAGGRRIIQITEWQCGYTTFAPFTVDERGRRTPQREITIVHDGC